MVTNMNDISRRNFLTGALAAGFVLCAPAIIRVNHLMALSVQPLPRQLLWDIVLVGDAHVRWVPIRGVTIGDVDVEVSAEGGLRKVEIYTAANPRPGVQTHDIGIMSDVITKIQSIDGRLFTQYDGGPYLPLDFEDARPA